MRTDNMLSANTSAIFSRIGELEALRDPAGQFTFKLVWPGDQGS